MAKDSGLCDVRSVDLDAVRADVRGVGGVSEHVRILYRDLHADRHLGARHGHRLHRLRRRAYGTHHDFICRKNAYQSA